jgi:enamine deaminase RidA (YjgF/YER057c/UK114 family)
MTANIQQRLKELNINIPDISPPAANYVPYVQSGKQIFISGQLPVKNSQIITGKVGQDATIEQAIEAAQACAINIVAVLKKACEGDLQKVARCVKLGIFVNCVDGFTDQPRIGNGASDLMVEIFGQIGQHARFAVGTNSLPFNALVEIDAIFEIL